MKSTKYHLAVMTSSALVALNTCARNYLQHSSAPKRRKNIDSTLCAEDLSEVCPQMQLGFTEGLT